MINDDVTDNGDGNEESSSQKKKQKKKQQHHSKRIFLHASSLKIPKYGVNVKQKYPDFWEPVLQFLRQY